MTIKQLFRVGDSVMAGKSGLSGVVVAVMLRSPRHITDRSGQVIYHSEQMYCYKLKGDNIPPWWITQESLQSATKCPNCETIEWDWGTGCGFCGLSADDLINYHTTDIFDCEMETIEL